MMRSGNSVSFHRGLITFETVYEERQGLFRPIARKENLTGVRSAVWFTPTNFTVI